jgi:cytochrome c oxidase subunit 2
MIRFWNRLALIALGVVLAASATIEPALAGIGEPSMWQMNMQTPVTEVARDINDLHDILIWVITAISLFVLGLLIYVMVKFNEKANPVPSKLTHNTLLEVAWILIPCLILVYIAIPSFKLLRLQIELPKPDITVKAIGHQWYWSYEYGQDQNGGFAFDSYMLTREDAVKAKQPALLAVDNELVLPAGKTIVVQVLGADVIHNFAMPAFGLKTDAVPGRLNETWFKADRVGTFYGQCSELCGVQHAFMPIEIKVVSQADFDAWVASKKAPPPAPAATADAAAPAAASTSTSPPRASTSTRPATRAT